MGSRIVAPAAASVLLVAVGIVLFVLAAGLRDGAAASNTALTDATATRTVIAAVSADVREIYSYSYTDIGATRSAARATLAGQAASQYAELAPLLGNAVSERLTVVTRVTRAGVVSMSGGAARLLLFLNQTSVRGGGKAASSAAQLAVTARMSGGRWLITSIEAR